MTDQTELDWQTARRRAGGWSKNKRWQLMRQRQLWKAPFCQCPHHAGKPDAPRAEVVDHITPHRGDPGLFFDPNNLQSMATVCHDRFKQSEEKGGAGFLTGCDIYGDPLDKSHPWYDQ